jgi:UDP-N-acetylglucosamine 3-dehydrogenase
MRIAIVGADRTAADYANRIETLEPTTLAGVASYGQAERVPESPTVTHADYETLYEEAAPDGVVLCVPPEDCREPAVAALRRGLPVLRPGRLAGTIVDAEAIVAAADAADAVALGGYTSSFSPERQTAVKRATDGELGSVGNVRLFRQWPADEAQTDVSPRVGPAVECFRLVAGGVSHVFARRTAPCSGSGMLVTLRSESDVVGHLDVRRGEGADQSGFEFAGTDGLVEFDSDDVAPVTLRRGGESTTEVPRERDAVASHLLHFRDCVQGDAPPRISVGDSLATLRVCQAIEDSADQGARVVPSEVGA